MRWFRFYSEVLHDPKVQRLPIALRWHWVEILCLANQGKPRGRLPPPADLAFGLHTSQKKVALVVVELRERGLLDEKDGHLVPHNWDERQPLGSVEGSTRRAQEYRERVRAIGGKPLSSATTRAEVFRRDGEVCIYCGSNQGLVIDHLVPLVRGGSNHLDNLTPACRRCNSGKAGRTPEEAGYGIRSATVADRLRNSPHITVAQRTATFLDTEAERDTEAEAEPHPAPVKRTAIREKNRGT